MKMNMRITGGLLGLAALLMGSQANAATIQLSPSVLNVDIGDPITLTVQGTGFINDVSAGSVTIIWNPATLQLDSSAVQIAATAAANGFPIDFGTDLSVPGQLDATYATFGTVLGPTFDFFSLNFTALSSSDIAIGIGPLGDWQDGSFPADPVIIDQYLGATVNVSAVPVPAAVWLFGSGLLGMIGIARRRKPQFA